ncbi:MAG: zf-HC2 domain-containing protein [Sedimenticola sp.]|nr:zf-HC2 domain-containing protein [Sedimenticola sp.]
MNRERCPDFDKLSAYVDYELSDGELGEVGSHIAECAGCRRTYDRLVQLGNVFSVMRQESTEINIVPDIERQLNREPGARSHGTRLYGRLLSYGLAASLALAVGVNLGNHLAPEQEVKIDFSFTQAAQMAPFSFIPPGSITLEHATCFIGTRI